MAYPALFIRIKAMLIDSTILAILFISLTILSTELGITDLRFKALFIFLPVILFEPLMIWTLGGSVGHQFSGIKIVGASSGKNLFVLNGIVRFITKTLLGIYSLVSMLITKRHQSIHDVLSHSVVVFKDETTAPLRHKLNPRETTFTSGKPSIIRKLVVIAVYLIISSLVVGIFISIIVSSDCLEYSRCSESENLYLFFTGVAFAVSLLLVFILGFFNKLPGAYYRAK